jgi:hypothetical protein
MTEYVRPHDVEGLAALGICESLLLALVELKIISKEDADGLLTDVATTHKDAITVSSEPDKHRAVVAIVEKLIVGARS